MIVVCAVVGGEYYMYNTVHTKGIVLYLLNLLLEGQSTILGYVRGWWRVLHMRGIVVFPLQFLLMIKASPSLL